MKNKPSIRLFLALVFFILPFILPAQNTEEDKQRLCQNNKEAFDRYQKRVKELEDAQKKLWNKEQRNKVRSQYDDVISAIQDLERFRTKKPAQDKVTDKEYTMELLDAIYDLEQTYTGKETLLEIIPKDFNANGGLIGTQPVNTIKTLRIIRNAIGKEIDRNAKLPDEIKRELDESKDKLSYHHNRMIELKCDEGSTDKTEPVKTENKDDKKDEKNVPKQEDEDWKPSVIELSEHTDKFGSFTATLTYNSKTGMYEGTYTNGVKDNFQLRVYNGQTFFMVRLNRYTSYSGTITGKTIKGQLIVGGDEGTFTATAK
jgi:hypothetical protein